MATQQPGDSEGGQRIFVKADEVDTGTSILSPSKHLPLSALAPPNSVAPADARPKAPPRPLLRRDGSSAPPPPPPSQPPPAPPVQASPDNPTDSLSLPQLRKLVSQFPKTDQRAYAFQYSDSDGLVAEIEEWFHYTEQDQNLILCARDTFEQIWSAWATRKFKNPKSSDSASWLRIKDAEKEDFLRHLLLAQTTSDISRRVESLECLTFIVLGAWSSTAGLVAEHQGLKIDPSAAAGKEVAFSRQVEWIHAGADLLAKTDDGQAVKWLFENLNRLASQRISPTDEAEHSASTVEVENDYHEIKLTLTCLYVLVESARSRPNSEPCRLVVKRLLDLRSNFITFLVDNISQFRWEDDAFMPLNCLIQLLWKSQLLIFGAVTTAFEQAKNILQPPIDSTSEEATYPVLTASPLDYHLFRQEIASKYPAYNPPPPLIPLETETRSMLPPLSSSSKPEPSVTSFSNNSAPPAGSILHQPVHIATPAPSPPPSPIGPGGKAGKKQNYQTNQNFPFLYPPLDDSSNMIGGMGTTQFQDTVVGRKWSGSDIPASILEAGELFASRMRMTRAMHQLWRERDLFMRYERGWRQKKSTRRVAKGRGKALKDKTQADLEEQTSDSDLEAIDQDDDLKRRFEQAEEVFHLSLQNLQSFVIVLMKVMLKNVQEIAIQNGGLQDANQGGFARTKTTSNLNQTQNAPNLPPAAQPHEMSIEDLDAIRSREISMKAIGGTIFVMLKWFKISHVLKFEYMTQLLLDSNYLQLTLKYFAHQNLEDLVGIKYDNEDLSFFRFCHLNSDNPPQSPIAATKPDPDSDDAVPPPIPRHRRTKSASSDKDKSQSSNLEVTKIASPGRGSASPQPMHTNPADGDNNSPTATQQNLRPAVDELGNPISPLPTTPITTYSYRVFQTSIHLLRVLQKLTRNKSHRILLLVQFKSSQILRRLLRIPDPTLRLYVLKLFKSQVPYCGRKWRQSNMRVITAVYLHVKPGLRDEWLVGLHDASTAAAVGAGQGGGGGGGPGGGNGGGGEGDVDEAVPMEWALRGLTFWWMKRCYGDVMKLKGKKDAKGEDAEEWAGGQEIEEDERDFFQRELDAMGWGVAGLGLGAGEDVEFGEEAPGMSGMNGAAMQNEEGVETV